MTNEWNEWFKFCEYVKHGNRFILNEEWNKYIAKILLIVKKNIAALKKDDFLYRARIGHDNIFVKVDKGIEWEDVAPLSKEKIGAPPFDKSTAGRINPKGIACLYLSRDPDTAMAEVRPWLNEHISIGIFKLKKDLKLINVSEAENISTIIVAHREKKELSPEDKENIVRSHLNWAFSTPISRSDEVLDYLPTQYLAETFKKIGYDGIEYASSLTEGGKNIAIFNPDDAEPMEGYLVRINKIKYEPKKHGDRVIYKKD